MPVRRFRRKKPTYKKRYYKRRRMMPRSNVRADATYSEKLTYETELYVQAGNATFCANWIRSGNAAPTQQYPVGQNPGNQQFHQCIQMFRTYRITGMKLEYRPYFFSLGNNDVVLRSLTCGTIMNVTGAQAIPANISEFRASLDAKQYDPMKPFKRYYHVGRWSKSVQVGWRNCTTAAGNQYAVNTPDCFTCLEIPTTGFADGALVGAVRVTYYAKFKDRLRD